MRIAGFAFLSLGRAPAGVMTSLAISDTTSSLSLNVMTSLLAGVTSHEASPASYSALELAKHGPTVLKTQAEKRALG